MKKIFKRNSFILFISINIVLLMILQVNAFDIKSKSQDLYSEKIIYNPASSLNFEEQKIIRKYDPLMIENEKIENIKMQGKIDEFISFFIAEYEKLSSDNNIETAEYLNSSNLKETDTVYDLKIKSKKLSKYYYNVVLDSDDFLNLTNKLMVDENYGISEKARKDSNFRPLYLYMCLLYDNSFNNFFFGKYSFDNDNDLKMVTLKEIDRKDFENDFSKTYSSILVDKFIEKNNIKFNPNFPKLNGDLIQNYAGKFAKKHNSYYHTWLAGDCTNFASQCLLAGSLPMVSNQSDIRQKGVVNAKDRWFYYNKGGNNNYAVSTSWIRVEELYNYVAPNYPHLVRKKGSEMTPFLNKGFLLQGKRRWSFRWNHSVIVTFRQIEPSDPIEKRVTYCAHTNDSRFKDINEFYKGFDKYRAVQVY